MPLGAIQKLGDRHIGSKREKLRGRTKEDLGLTEEKQKK